jgi:hypothetical protein
MRSRAVSFPFSCCLAMRSAPESAVCVASATASEQSVCLRAVRLPRRSACTSEVPSLTAAKQRRFLLMLQAGQEALIDLGARRRLLGCGHRRACGFRCRLRSRCGEPPQRPSPAAAQGLLQNATGGREGYFVVRNTSKSRPWLLAARTPTIKPLHTHESATRGARQHPDGTVRLQWNTGRSQRTCWNYRQLTQLAVEPP